MKGNRVKISLIFAIAAMLMCVAALVGTTFAWFTSSITSGGNTITAGSLSVSATVYSVTSSTPTIATDLTSGEELSNKTFSASGSTAYYIIAVTNTGGIDAAVKVTSTASITIAEYGVTESNQVQVGNNNTGYYSVTKTNTIYFLLTDSSNSAYTVTVNACNIVKDAGSSTYVSSGFTDTITSVSGS